MRTDIPALKAKIFELVKTNKIQEAVSLCDENPSPVAKILKAGLEKFGSPREEIKQNMEEAGLLEVPKLESRLSGLSTIAHITPLLGLLGTVMGMFSCFHTIQLKTAALSPVTVGDLAGGIGEALLTTAAGLIVAIPAFLIYNYSIARVNHMVMNMERAALESVNFLCHITENPD
ncbi:MAG: MotA/TolQ/ExbB proton channel family protein [Candidatus Omnitrophica bacterium]|nr:MotA/TolQ/ExbB proton channel family protein [Candidatus Omnitrophota bacterium]